MGGGGEANLEKQSRDQEEEHGGGDRGETESPKTKKKPQGEKGLKGAAQAGPSPVTPCSHLEQTPNLPGIFLHLRNGRHNSACVLGLLRG